MMGGTMLIFASLAAPTVAGGLTGDGSDAQTPHAYPNGVHSGAASYFDLTGAGRK
jgi:hypothetical protein